MPEQTDALAFVYARSLYELAEQADGGEKIAEVADELEQICELLRESRKFGEFLASPIVDSTARGEVLRKIFSNRVTDLTLRFLLVLNDNGRLGHLEMISSAFDRLEQEAYGRIEVDVYTVAPLKQKQVDSIQDRIRKAIGKEPVVHPYTDSTMMGGIKLRIGDQMIDGSVAGKLRRMNQELQSAGGSRLRNRITDFFTTD